MHRTTKESKQAWEKWTKLEASYSLMPPGIKLYYKVIIIKTVWHWHKETSVVQNRELRNKPTHTWPTNLWQRRRECIMGKHNLQQVVLGKLRATCKRIKFNQYLTLYTKLNSKWTTDLNVRAETMKLLEENLGELNSLTSVLVMIFWIRHQNQRQLKQD